MSYLQLQLQCVTLYIGNFYFKKAHFHTFQDDFILLSFLKLTYRKLLILEEEKNKEGEGSVLDWHF